MASRAAHHGGAVVTAVGWDPDGWDDDEQVLTPTTPVYRCEGPCCWTPPRPPGLLARIRNAIRPTKEQ